MTKERKEERLGEYHHNYQHCLMKIVEYNNASNIIVEFQDEYKARVHAAYREFLNGKIKNPYYPNAYNGIVGTKYLIKIKGKTTKEYRAWYSMLLRCFNQKYKEKEPTYNDVFCCKEWLLFENFYEWLHSQENFDKWLTSEQWAIDKDILIKRNKIYSPETCCLVPKNVNNLFTKHDALRGDLPIGVSMHDTKFRARCMNPFIGKTINLKDCETLEQAFQVYKRYKEDCIKQVAINEFDKGNITEKCYQAMMQYEVEIDD